jgi:PHD/YefM family antitoxin component YafN of YafNO toxin-antitoxin module
MKSLDKIIALVKKTGDRCIVLDTDGEPAFVLTSFDDYERLMTGGGDPRHLTEDELLEKINRDIALWRETQEVDEDIGEVPVAWQSVGDVLKETKMALIKPQNEQVEIPKKELNQAKKEENKDVYKFEEVE